MSHAGSRKASAGLKNCLIYCSGTCVLCEKFNIKTLILHSCKQNCANKICLSKRFSLVASCFEGCIGRLIYEWQVYKKVGNGSVKSWQLQTDIVQNLAEVKDPKGPVFTLPKNVLQGSSEYLIRLYGRREKGISGKTESVFLTNEVPKGGACFGSPRRGDALVTKFYIWCEGWEDSDTPLSYEFYYKNDEGKSILFYYGFHNSTYSELPLGNPARDYTLEIYVKVLDFFKGAAHYHLLLQVRFKFTFTIHSFIFNYCKVKGK